MTNKNENELVSEFKALEKKLIETLKLKPIKFGDEDGNAAVKKNIKNYIKKVEEAKEILKKYEEVAIKLNELANENVEPNEEVAKAVVKLRKEPKVNVSEIELLKESDQKNEKEEVVVEIENGKAVSKTRKKKKDNSSREF